MVVRVASYAPDPTERGYRHVMARAELEQGLADGSSPARVRQLLVAELARSAAELAKKRAGYDEPVTVAFAGGRDVVAVAPVPASTRADPERHRLAGPLLVALREVGGSGVEAGEFGGYLALAVHGDAELAALAFDEEVAGIDRLRAAALLVPVLEIADRRPLLAPAREDGNRPHDDPDPRRRAARRILQRLDGMGKWGGFHTEFAHVARGFEGNERALALEVGEELIAAGLLVEKPSVGQRHVSLNPRQAGAVRRMIDGEMGT